MGTPGTARSCKLLELNTPHPPPSFKAMLRLCLPGSQSRAGASSGQRCDFGPEWGHGEGCGSTPCGFGGRGMFGEQLAWGVGAPLQMGEMCLVPPPPVPLLGWWGASAEPCWDAHPQELQPPAAPSLVPLAEATAPKVRDVSSVLERPLLFPSYFPRKPRLKMTFFPGCLLLYPQGERSADGCVCASSSSAACGLAAEGLSLPSCPQPAWSRGRGGCRQGGGVPG